MKVKEKEFTKYPIYRIVLKWIQDGKHDPKYPKSYEGLPEGRVFNGTSAYVMEREVLSDQQLKAKADEWAAKVLSQDKHKSKSPELYKLTCEFHSNESWNLTWFCHETFDTGQTDQEALASFEDFVRRKEYENMKNGYDEFSSGGYCLMGAGDRWRWRGIDNDGNDTKAPCRCSGCKKAGMIRIQH